MACKKSVLFTTIILLFTAIIFSIYNAHAGGGDTITQTLQTAFTANAGGFSAVSIAVINGDIRQPRVLCRLLMWVIFLGFAVTAMFTSGIPQIVLTSGAALLLMFNLIFLPCAQLGRFRFWESEPDDTVVECGDSGDSTQTMWEGVAATTETLPFNNHRQEYHSATTAQSDGSDALVEPDSASRKAAKPSYSGAADATPQRAFVDPNPWWEIASTSKPGEFEYYNQRTKATTWDKPAYVHPRKQATYQRPHTYLDWCQRLKAMHPRAPPSHATLPTACRRRRRLCNQQTLRSVALGRISHAY